MAKYRKTILALVTGLLGWATMVVTSPSGPIAAAEWVALATAIVTACGVYAIPNTIANTIPTVVASSSPIPPTSTVDGGL